MKLEIKTPYEALHALFVSTHEMVKSVFSRHDDLNIFSSQARLYIFNS